ncbi:conserved hypothetical protein [Pediculus humanus corporis]|uniref:Uncharacterized protein n=1 Tax=Pediculus humanus subsp. corporis TaxID=121224 RepID=E0VT80_PEDHC|nr:uncharacterized protein Phum_PHUM428010 [Pediculus humanus corporis]EEB16586.1 conserved hypothetical protein [Pediculus humanus corporis]
MTNWPSIQELRKFESKFIDNSKYEDLKLTSSNTIPSTTTDTTTTATATTTNVNESITASKTKIIDSDDLNFIENNNNNNNKSVENLCCKTVRCVMKKNIQDSIKKYDRGDVEAEKKAEILKREEESRALRQNLAALSYRQWKERLKGRTMTLPKNGYQIFGPKPIPVVKEDWNRNFINSSPRHNNNNNNNQNGFNLRISKSNTSSTMFAFRPELKELENYKKDGENDTKITTTTTTMMAAAAAGAELATILDKNKNLIKNVKSVFDLNFIPLKELQTESTSKINFYKNDITVVPPSQQQQQPTNCLLTDIQPNNKIHYSTSHTNHLFTNNNNNNNILNTDYYTNREKPYIRHHTVANNSDTMPLKKKLDLYINAPPSRTTLAVERKKNYKNDKKTATATTGITKTKSFGHIDNDKIINDNKNFMPMKTTKKNNNINERKKEDGGGGGCTILKNVDKKPLKKTESVTNASKNIKSKCNLRSRSYDKQIKKKQSKELLLIKNKLNPRSKSFIKINKDDLINRYVSDDDDDDDNDDDSDNDDDDGERKLIECEIKKKKFKKKPLKKSISNCNGGDNVRGKTFADRNNGSDVKLKKKYKKKNNNNNNINNLITKSQSFTDSPYCVKNQKKLKNHDKNKTGKRKNFKDGETKSDTTTNAGQKLKKS